MINLINKSFSAVWSKITIQPSLLFGVAVVVIFSAKLGLLKADVAISIVGTSGVFLAAFKYYEEKETLRKSSAIDQIEFFRERVIKEHDTYIIKLNSGRIPYTRIRLDLPRRDELIKNQPNEYEIQARTLANLELRAFQTTVLNLVEDFSIRVILNKTHNYRALDTVKPVFIQIVENSAVAILDHQEKHTGPTAYSNVLELYSLWFSSVDRTYPRQ